MTDMETPTIEHESNAVHALRYGIPINYRWLVEFIMLPLIILGFGAWLTAMNAKIAELQLEVAKLNNFQVENRTNIKNINGKIDREVSGRLDRIDAKLDAIIDRQFGTQFRIEATQ